MRVSKTKLQKEIEKGLLFNKNLQIFKSPKSMKKGRIAISFLNLLFLSLDVAAIVTPLLKANSKQGNVQSITCK